VLDRFETRRTVAVQSPRHLNCRTIDDHVLAIAEINLGQLCDPPRLSAPGSASAKIEKGAGVSRPAAAVFNAR
jgi:hypothetical protein